MDSQLPPVLAAALLPFAPPESAVHKIVQSNDWLRKLNHLGATERRDMREAVTAQNSYIERTGGLL